jgi:hypothetical protein
MYDGVNHAFNNDINAALKKGSGRFGLGKNCSVFEKI